MRYEWRKPISQLPVVETALPGPRMPGVHEGPRGSPQVTGHALPPSFVQQRR